MTTEPLRECGEVAAARPKFRRTALANWLSECTEQSACSTAEPVSPRGPLANLRCDQLRWGRSFEEDYELSGKVLGTGLSGAVLEAVCLHTRQQRVAVKSFSLAAMAPHAIDNLRHEIEIQATIDHTGIARVDAVYLTEQKATMVLELLEGGDMFGLIADSPGTLSESHVARIMKQLLETIDYLHSNGVMHRDIKPENLVLESPTGESFKLIDFGFARNFQDGEFLSEKCGTVQYSAPEVLHAPSGYTNKVDLWSAGCVAQALLTGRIMYRGSQQEVYQKVAKGKADFSQAFLALTPGAQDFVHSLLVFDPTQRPSASQALRHPWLSRALVDAAQPRSSCAAARQRSERGAPKKVRARSGWSALAVLRDFVTQICTV